MKGKQLIIIPVISAVFILLITVLVAVAVEQAPLLIADGLVSIADAFFDRFTASSSTRWLNDDYIYLSQYDENDCRYYYLALSVSFYYLECNESSIVSDHQWDEYLKCFNLDTETEAFEAVKINYGFQIAENEEPFILGFASELQRMNGRNNHTEDEIYSIEDITIDFGSKYYSFSSNLAVGNPCVCDHNNNIAWPYNKCVVLSTFREFNKMICSSYASGRYWEVNFHDDPFPLPLNWDAQITLRHCAPGNGTFSTDVLNPLPKSIISIHHAGGNHDAFIESVGKDGSVVVSECNASYEKPYGFRVRKFQSLQSFLDSYGIGTYLNGMYGK